MRKAILLMLLAVSGSAAAEWIQISSDEISVGYADAATIVRTDNTAKMWSLFDFRKFQLSGGTRYLSETWQHEYDCKDKRRRKSYLSVHSGNMARGAVIYSDVHKTEWKSIPTGSVMDLMWNIACGKR
jgi:hypothetical protein